MSLRTIKKGESGRSLVINAGIDISSASSFEVTLTDPVGGETVVLAVLGTAEVTGKTTDCIEVTLAANEYVVYTIQASDFNRCGTWTYFLTAIGLVPAVRGSIGTLLVVD